jgi:hypothetical protein
MRCKARTKLGAWGSPSQGLLLHKPAKAFEVPTLVAAKTTHSERRTKRHSFRKRTVVGQRFEEIQPLPLRQNAQGPRPKKRELGSEQPPGASGERWDEMENPTAAAKFCTGDSEGRKRELAARRSTLLLRQ